MYTTPDEARSDLFLAGIVYVFGAVVIALLLDIVPLQQVPGVGVGLALLVPVVTTVLVPYLLIRYRKESLSAYGLGRPDGALATGAVAALPLVVASVLASLTLGSRPLGGLPVVALAPGEVLGVVVRLLTWLGLAGLAVYGTVKARDAFRADYRGIRDVGLEIGRWIGIVLAVTTVLLVAALAVRGAALQAVQYALFAAAAAATFWLVHRSLPQRTTSRATLLTPVVLLAIGPFALSFDAAQLVLSVWLAAVNGAVGLVIGLLQETRGSAWGAVGLGLVIALLTTLPGGVGL